MENVRDEAYKAKSPEEPTVGESAKAQINDIVTTITETVKQKAENIKENLMAVGDKLKTSGDTTVGDKRDSDSMEWNGNSESNLRSRTEPNGEKTYYERRGDRDQDWVAGTAPTEHFDATDKVPKARQTPGGDAGEIRDIQYKRADYEQIGGDSPAPLADSNARNVGDKEKNWDPLEKERITAVNSYPVSREREPLPLKEQEFVHPGFNTPMKTGDSMDYTTNAPSGVHEMNPASDLSQRHREEVRQGDEKRSERFEEKTTDSPKLGM